MNLEIWDDFTITDLCFTHLTIFEQTYDFRPKLRILTKLTNFDQN